MNETTESAEWQFTEKNVSVTERAFYEKITKEQGEKATIAAALKNFRQVNCMTQTEAAADCGVDRTSWGAWERGSRRMMVTTKAHLCCTGHFHSAHFGAVAFNKW